MEDKKAPSYEKQHGRAVINKENDEINKSKENHDEYIKKIIEKFNLSKGVEHLGDEILKYSFRNFPQGETNLPRKEANWCLTRVMLDKLETVPPQGQKYQRNIVRYETKSDTEFNLEGFKKKSGDEILKAAGIDINGNWIIDLPVGSLYSEVEYVNGLDYIGKKGNQYFMVEAKSNNSEGKSFKESIKYVLGFVDRLTNFYKEKFPGDKINVIGVVSDDTEKAAAVKYIENRKDTKISTSIKNNIFTVREFISGAKVVKINKKELALKLVRTIADKDTNFKLAWFKGMAPTEQKPQQLYFDY